MAFSPPIDQISAVQTFLERFSDLKYTTIQAIKTNVLAIGSKETIKNLVSLYDAVFKNSDKKIIHVENLNRIEAQDAEKILIAYFSQSQKNARPSFLQGAIDELTCIAQDNSLIHQE